MIGFLKKNWFLCGLFAVMGLALAAPAVGAALNAGKVLSTGAVVAIFVVSGLSLPSEQLRRGLRNVRAHLFLQAFIFGLVPAWFYATAGCLGHPMGGHFIWGVYALAVFPTTISSCIVMTQLARGNAATAIFNAIIANLLGVFVSPLLLTLLLSQSGGAMPVGEMVRIFSGLLLKVLAPFAAGQLLRLRWRESAGRNKKALSTFSGAMILAIVYFAFCRGAGNEELWTGLSTLSWPFAYLALSNILLMVLAFGGARLVGLAAGDVTAAVFIAPQKTLAMGIPLLTTYFASQPEVLGAAMLPVLFYHPWQLLTAGVARRFVAIPEGE